MSDLGFSLTHLAGFLTVLARWKELGDADEVAFGYRASAAAIEAAAVRSIDGLTEKQAAALVRFATLDADRIRRLPGKAEDEADVPIWEHAKRVHRYALRPLIEMRDKTLGWGAAAAERSLSVWTGSVANGYLPADLDWPHIVNTVDAIKSGLEEALERQAFDVVARATPHVLANVNFMRRFARERFDDVGDFDVLAYWPAANRWLVVECKYNKPPHCLKDAARLRREIFGPRGDPWQFRKIETRRRFLMSRVEQLRQLLGWPKAHIAGPPALLEAYVSRQVFWWMRNPPYPVPTEFVRIDALDSWMRSRNLLA